MKASERAKYLEIKAERDMLRRRLSTAIDKELLLLMQVIELKEELERIREVHQGADRRAGQETQ